MGEQSPKKPGLIRLLREIQQTESARHRTVQSGEPDEDLLRLRLWQSKRLSKTYADFLADPGFAPATHFFLEDIYGARDFSRRDADFEQLHAVLSRFLPVETLKILAEAIQLNRFSALLDERLLAALLGEYGSLEELDAHQYALGYRICDNRAEREKQIEWLAGLLAEVWTGVRRPLTGITLRAARMPAMKAGWRELYSFLERGYQAYQPVRDIGPFIEAVREREFQALKRIFDGDPDPFRQDLS